MRRKRLTGVAATAIAIVAMAATGMAMTTDPGPDRAPFTLPPDVRAVAPDVYALGAAKDKGRTVQGYAFVHRRDGEAKGGNGKGRGGSSGGSGDVGSSTCYAYLANGANWSLAEPWIANTSNNDGLSPADLFANLETDVSKWETAAGDVDIFGGGTQVGEVLSADTDSTDGVNEVYFAAIDDPGVIAVTIVWGVFRGPPSARGLVEWDQVYDDDFDWSLTGELTEMDFENIATHEIGHAAGMGHPDLACDEETMHRFASEGEIQKRDLNPGDIAGIDALY